MNSIKAYGFIIPMKIQDDEFFRHLAERAARVKKNYQETEQEERK
jgi:hypothetical protein